MQASSNYLNYNTITDEEKDGNIKDIIKGLSDDLNGKIIVVKGQLWLVSSDDIIGRAASIAGLSQFPFDVSESGELQSTNNNTGLVTDKVLSIPETEAITKIGDGAFAKLDNVETIIIPGTIKEIGDYAFANNTQVKKIVINEGVEKIGNHSFMGLTNLIEIELPNSITRIEKGFLNKCSKIEKVTLPANLSYIGDAAFQTTSNLKEIIIPDNLEYFGNTENATLAPNTFGQCYNLEYIYIGKNLTNFRPDCFRNCNNIKEVEIAEENEYFYIKDNFLLCKNGDEVEPILHIKTETELGTKLSLPEDITTIRQPIFSWCAGVTDVELPSTLEKIEEMGIFGCVSSITNFSFPNGNENLLIDNGSIYSKDYSVLYFVNRSETVFTVNADTITIGTWAIQGNTEILTISDKVEKLSECCLYSSKIKNLYIGKNVKEIHPNFMGFGSHGASLVITISEDNSNFKIVDNYIVSKDGKTLYTFVKKAVNTGNSSIIIPEGIEEISESAFLSNNMTRITFPSTLKKINGRIFANVTTLQSIDIPSSVEEIASNAFYGCSSLTDIYIKNIENSILGAPWGVETGMRAIHWSN